MSGREVSITCSEKQHQSGYLGQTSGPIIHQRYYAAGQLHVGDGDCSDFVCTAGGDSDNSKVIKVVAAVVQVDVVLVVSTALVECSSITSDNSHSIRNVMGYCVERSSF